MIDFLSDVTKRYTLFGILFGSVFPVFALFIDAWQHDASISWSGIVLLHDMNFIHYVVDMAPFVLGFSGFLLGRSVQRKLDAYDRLMKINQSLDVFTFKITHDLRGPALNIKGLLDYLIDTETKEKNDESKALLGRLDSSVTKWLSVFEDFVDLLKKERAGINMQKPCDLKRVLYRVEKDFSFEIQKNNAKINTDFSACKFVFASEFDLISIFKNLISNSIKYAHPERDVEIYIQSIRAQNNAIIMIEDNGIGIDLENEGHRLFGIFERLGEDTHVEGTGVGLYLVKEQVEKNGGKVEVESTPYVGTTFTITMPIISLESK